MKIWKLLWPPCLDIGVVVLLLNSASPANAQYWPGNRNNCASYWCYGPARNYQPRHGYYDRQGRYSPPHGSYYAPEGGYNWSWGGGNRGYLGGRGGGWGGEW